MWPSLYIACVEELCLQTEQSWAGKLKEAEAEREKQLAEKDEQWNQQMQSTQGEAGNALEQLRAEHASEMQDVTEAHGQQIAAFQV